MSRIQCPNNYYKPAIPSPILDPDNAKIVAKCFAIGQHLFSVVNVEKSSAKLQRKDNQQLAQGTPDGNLKTS